MFEFINVLVENQSDKNESDIIGLLKEKKFTDKQILENLMLLNEIKKKKLTKLIASVNKKSDTLSKKTKIYHYTQGEILEAFKNDDEFLNKTYKVAELKVMYETIYNSEPRKEMKKQDLIESIRYRFRVLDRASHFNN